MDNNNSTNSIVKDDAFWLNEVKYFETAMDAMKMCFAMLSAQRDYAVKQMSDTAPDREEVNV